MTFLTPIPAIIAAALAVPALLVFYFLKLRRRPVRVSSTMLWEQATHDLQVNVPLRWIRFSLLLLLQLLILALLLLALGRPAIAMPGAPSTRVIIAIDRSASMSATDAPQHPTRLDMARARALEIIDESLRGPGRSEVMVIAFAHDARALTGFTVDRGALRAAVEAIEPTDQPADIQTALDLIGAVSAPEPDEASEPDPPAAVLLSDGWFGPTPPLTVSNAAVQYEAMGPLPDENGPPNINNLGIAAVSARRDHEDPSLIRVFARIVNASREEVAATVDVLLDGARVQRRAVRVPGAENEGDRPALGEAAATFELRSAGGGVVLVSIGREDALEADNAAAVVLAPPARPRILLVVPEEDAAATPTGDRVRPVWVLSEALRALEPRALRLVSVAQADGMQAEGRLGEFDLIVYDRVSPQRVPDRPSLSFGAAPPIPGLSLRLAAAPTDIVSWRRTHPVLRDVSLDQVRIARPRAVDFQEGPEGRRTARLEELARGQEGTLIGLVELGTRGMGARHIVVGFDLMQSTWWTTLGFPIFLANAAEHLTPGGDATVGRFFRTTEPAEVLAAPDADRVTLRGPMEVSVAVERQETDAGPRRVSVGVLERAGVYTVQGSVMGPPAVAVNLVNEVQSSLGVAPAITIGGRTLESAAMGTRPREVWHWFVLAALLLLIGEWFVNALLMKT